MRSSASPTSFPPTGDDLARACRPDVTASVTRGVARLLGDMGCSVLLEMRLKNGRRADLVGLCPKGNLTIVEVKSCQADFDADNKWGEYLDYCDQFFFAVAEDFPVELLPEDHGLIIADGFGGAIVRAAETRKLVAARRKAVTLAYARQAAFAGLRAPETPTG